MRVAVLNSGGYHRQPSHREEYECRCCCTKPTLLMWLRAHVQQYVWDKVTLSELDHERTRTNWEAERFAARHRPAVAERGHSCPPPNTETLLVVEL